MITAPSGAINTTNLTQPRELRTWAVQLDPFRNHDDTIGQVTTLVKV